MSHKLDWKEISNTIRDCTNLASCPVAIRLVETRKDLLKYPTTTVMPISRRNAVCQLVAIARYYRNMGTVYTTREHMACAFGAACLGLIKTPERISSGKIHLGVVKDEKAARRLEENVVLIGDGDKRYDAIVCAPLDLTPLDPQVIVSYVTPAQALRLIIASVYHSGEAIEVSTTGQGSLCTSIAKVMLQGKPVLDIPCIGDRAFGHVEEQEMIFAFPAEFAGQLIEGLKETERPAAHPFKPFLHWPVMMPRGELETSEKDLEL